MKKVTKPAAKKSVAKKTTKKTKAVAKKAVKKAEKKASPKKTIGDRLDAETRESMVLKALKGFSSQAEPTKREVYAKMHTDKPIDSVCIGNTCKALAAGGFVKIVEKTENIRGKVYRITAKGKKRT